MAQEQGLGCRGQVVRRGQCGRSADRHFIAGHWHWPGQSAFGAQHDLSACQSSLQQISSLSLTDHQNDMNLKA